MHIELKSIGIIHTPYHDSAPYQPLTEAEGECYLELDEGYAPALFRMDEFRYIYVLFYAHQDSTSLKTPVETSKSNISLEDSKPIPLSSFSSFSPQMSIPWSHETQAGIFATRSPFHPNRIGLSIARIQSIVGSRVYISSIDAFDGTPLLDIKPYLRTLDVKSDANDGWVEKISDKEHLALHLKGLPH